MGGKKGNRKRGKKKEQKEVTVPTEGIANLKQEERLKKKNIMLLIALSVMVAVLLKASMQCLLIKHLWWCKSLLPGGGLLSYSVGSYPAKQREQQWAPLFSLVMVMAACV